MSQTPASVIKATYSLRVSVRVTEHKQGHKQGNAETSGRTSGDRGRSRDKIRDARRETSVETVEETSCGKVRVSKRKQRDNWGNKLGDKLRRPESTCASRETSGETSVFSRRDLGQFFA